MIQKTLAQVARETVVTIDSPEEGEATERKAIQLVRVEPHETMVGSIIALYDDGAVYECIDGSTAWNEVEMP